MSADLGMVGNIISGLIGGGVLGQIVTLLLPAITAAAQSGNLSVGGIMLATKNLRTRVKP
jgi:hypothetical protein